jgi:hypothetical protein
MFSGAQYSTVSAASRNFQTAATCRVRALRRERTQRPPERAPEIFPQDDKLIQRILPGVHRVALRRHEDVAASGVGGSFRLKSRSVRRSSGAVRGRPRASDDAIDDGTKRSTEHEPNRTDAIDGTLR